ncbi:MAG: hypothetical protein LH472_09820 [Pyrinomonadaceae bacterium]|nr:hypothetical protein [Pyrinomonadaceae bacterium]
MKAHRIETVVGSNQTVVLENLPFREGEEIEVIVLEKKVQNDYSHSLRGTVIKYDAPFEAVAGEDWEAAK